MIMGATTLLIGATAFIPMYHTPGTPPPCALRTSRILAYVGPEESETGLQNNPLLYVKTKGGLSYKDVERGNGESLSDDAIVELQYTASLISTGEVVEKTREGRPLTFQLGKGKADVFAEAIEGMAIGGERRVLIPPSSIYSSLKDDTVEISVRLSGVKSGADAVLWKHGRSIVRLALLASFVPDVLHFAGILPEGAKPVLAQAGEAVAPHVDAANAWAVQGLQA